MKTNIVSKFKYKKFFLFFILVFGFVFTFLIPPFQKPDENTHYERAVSLSDGQFFCKSNIGFTLNNGYHNLVREMGYFSITQKYEKKFPKTLLKLNKNQEIGKIEQGYSACGLNFLGYIPNSFGLFLGKLFNYPLLSFYLARLFGFLFFVFCFYWSLKIIGNSNYIYVLYFYGLIPMVLHQASAISYDVVQLSLMPLIFSLFINLLQPGNKNNKSRKLLFCSILMIFVFIKPGYYPVLLLYFLLPDVFKKKNIFKTIFFCLLFIFSFILIYKLTNLSVVSSHNLQLDLIKDNPTYFLKVLINTTFKKMPIYFEEMIGVFGFLDYKLQYFIYPIFFTFYFLLCFYISRKIKNSEIIKTKKILFISIILIFVYSLVHFALYLVNTIVAKDVVDGVQGRYFLCLIPLLMIVTINFFKTLNNKNIRYCFSIFIFVVILGCVCNSIYSRYYDYSQTFSDTEEIEKKYNDLILKKYKLDKVEINSKKTFLIDVNKDRKIGGFEMIYDSENKKIELPYKYFLKNKDCNKIFFNGYFDQNSIQKNGLYKVVFNKIIELKDDKICLEIEPINSSNQNYIGILSSDSELMLNVLYIQN